MDRRPHRRYRHWPAPWRALHTATLVLLPWLLLSGVALYYPPWHTALIPYLRLIYDGHVAAGVAWLAIFLAPLIWPPRFGQRRTLSAIDWFPLQALGLGAAVTGGVLVLPGLFDAFWRQSSFLGHGLFALAVALAAAAHGAAKLLRLPVRRLRFVPERRQFLSAAGWASVAALLWPVWARNPLTLAAAPGRGHPPGEGTPGEFITYSAAGFIPQIRPSAYRLTLDGRVRSPRVFTLEELMALEAWHERRAFQCVTGWVVPNVAWTGVRLSTLLAQVRPLLPTPVVRFWSADGVYTDTLTWSEAHLPDVLLAYAIDGEPLPPDRGGPVRLVVPEMYGYKSVKWVNRVELIDHPVLGYWEVRGYPSQAYLGSV